ncbi:MAG: hypothetical protein ABII06_04665 [Pseudomonadota bacterium]
MKRKLITEIEKIERKLDELGVIVEIGQKMVERARYPRRKIRLKEKDDE